MIQTYRLTLCYEGTRYHGWERKQNQDTVQGKVEDVLARLCAEAVKVDGAGRTDAGVHARAMVASTRLDTSLSPEELRGIVVLDMSGYPPRIQNLITAVVLGLLWQALRRRFPQGLARMEKLVVVDEADEILGRDIPVVKRLLREGAQCGLGMILAAREPEHIDDDEKPCLDLWAVHSLEAPKRAELERIFGEAVPEQQMQELRKLQRHQCLLKSKGAGALSMQDLPF
jgi:hypothetical protein